jgi:serine/threonine-protein kinase
LRRAVERDGPLNYKQVVRYVEEIAGQLADVHRTQPFHGNVRPSNIFVDQDGSVQLGPSISEFHYSIVNEESISGVVDCLAPEQALNVTRADGRADIYSLGCTLYFLLAGRPPFPNGSIAERLLQHQTAIPESLGSLRPDVPATLVQICEKMMAKKPVDRFVTANDVVDALAALREKQ